MKTITNLLAAVVIFSSGFSQTHSVSKPNAFSTVIATVLNDFPSNYRHICGDLVMAQGEFENYASTVMLPGAENCIITRYHSAEDTTASWQAHMFRGDDYKKAAQQYRELYNQVKNCSFRFTGDSAIFLKGEWTAPKEEKSFTASTLRLVTTDRRYKELKIDVELLFEVTDWVVNINVVSKKPDDEVGIGMRDKE